MIATGTSFEGKRVVIYTRASTTWQEKNDTSLLGQIATVDRWIEENGATRVHVFSESAVPSKARAVRSEK